MPNVKLFVNAAVMAQHDALWDDLLGQIRSTLCEMLGVQPAACHIVMVAVRPLPDQPAMNLELHILPRPDRTRARITEVCTALQGRIAAATGLRPAIRCAMLDPETYVALK